METSGKNKIRNVLLKMRGRRMGVRRQAVFFKDVKVNDFFLKAVKMSQTKGC